MSKDTEEILEAVEQINYQLTEILGDNNTIMLEYTTVGYCSCIEFLGQQVWNSEDDEREWIERQEYSPEELEMMKDCIGQLDHIPAHYEPMEGFLKKKVMELLKTISKIKL